MKSYGCSWLFLRGFLFSVLQWKEETHHALGQQPVHWGSMLALYHKEAHPALGQQQAYVHQSAAGGHQSAAGGH
jgi:hypothetical protein